MSYKILTLSDSTEWNDLLHRLPIEQQDVYFTPEYYSLYENFGDGKALCFVYKENEDLALYPFLINSINCLGYKLDHEYFDIQGAYGYNGFVCNTEEEEFVKQFWKVFGEYCHDNFIVAEFTRLHPFINNPNQFKSTHSVIYDRKTVFFDLKLNDELVFIEFQHSTKRQIKRATNRFGIELKIFEGNSDNLDELIEIYCSTMRKVESTEYLFFNKRYFEEFMRLSSSVILVAFLEGRPISVIFGIYSNNYFHGHLSGSLKDFMHMSPSSYLYWEMFKYAQSKGCSYLHLGGGDTSEEDNPLLKFKMNFSKKTLDFHIAKKIHNNPIYEEVIRQWGIEKPEKVKLYQNLLLKYRY